MTIAKITRAYIRTYTDNDQITAYVEWVDRKGKAGRTEGLAQRIGDQHCWIGPHMAALFARAEREGVQLEQETW